MQITRERLEIRQLRKWYDQMLQGPKPSKTELALHFRGYADQAEILIRRVEDGQPWEDFVMGLDGAPAILRRRLIKQVQPAKPSQPRVIPLFSPQEALK